MIFSLVFLGSTVLLSHLESLPQATAFFKDEAKPEDIQALQQQIESSGKAASVKYVSKDEALQIYQKQHQDDKLLLELVTSDILPASLEVSAKKVSDLADISDTMKASPAVKEVILAKDVVDKLAKFSEGTRFVTILLSILLLLSLAFTTLFIISLRVVTQKEEIETLRLLGSGKWRIFWPFLLEGMVYACISAVISGVFCFLVTPYIASFYQDVFLGVLPSIPITVHLAVTGAGIILGALASFVGGLIAANRYIKV